MELVMVVVVFGTIIMIVDQLRRLIANFVLNRTIREALKHHPEIAATLIAKLEPSRSWPLSLFGWMLLGLGLLSAAAAAISGEQFYGETLFVAAGLVLLGLIILSWCWWNTRS